MSKRKVITAAERAARFAFKAHVRIHLAEVSSGRSPNWELELAMAWLAGHQETKDFVTERIK